eukprot:Cvel_25938.t1-p1 / transcript=Cvel_25938.t1 / gene=Cvel_25938 / organism=Chromera_velia_CCMP2878 / gene_product=hypothetical protein / transcript_product=hypothetical protein / location=Cvel_scaffold3003:16519-21167(+) / protein_length=679 / sequence_SO=supercontig / SO=protein_coding / is_pseudo=false
MSMTAPASSVEKENRMVGSLARLPSSSSSSDARNGEEHQEPLSRPRVFLSGYKADVSPSGLPPLRRSRGGSETARNRNLLLHLELQHYNSAILGRTAIHSQDVPNVAEGIGQEDSRDKDDAPRQVVAKIAVAHASVSRSHAILSWNGVNFRNLTLTGLEDIYGLFVMDLSSENSTTVNDERLTPFVPRALKVGDRIRLAFAPVEFLIEQRLVEIPRGPETLYPRPPHMQAVQTTFLLQFREPGGHAGTHRWGLSDGEEGGEGRTLTPDRRKANARARGANAAAFPLRGAAPRALDHLGGGPWRTKRPEEAIADARMLERSPPRTLKALPGAQAGPRLPGVSSLATLSAGALGRPLPDGLLLHSEDNRAGGEESYGVYGEGDEKVRAAETVLQLEGVQGRERQREEERAPEGRIVAKPSAEDATVRELMRASQQGEGPGMPPQDEGERVPLFATEAPPGTHLFGWGGEKSRERTDGDPMSELGTQAGRLGSTVPASMVRQVINRRYPQIDWTKPNLPFPFNHLEEVVKCRNDVEVLSSVLRVWRAGVQRAFHEGLPRQDNPVCLPPFEEAVGRVEREAEEKYRKAGVEPQEREGQTKKKNVGFVDTVLGVTGKGSSQGTTLGAQPFCGIPLENPTVEWLNSVRSNPSAEFESKRRRWGREASISLGYWQELQAVNDGIMR